MWKTGLLSDHRERLGVFDPITGQWLRVKGSRAEVSLTPGGGKLVRTRR